MSDLQTLLDQLNVLKVSMFALQSSPCECCMYKRNLLNGLKLPDISLTTADVDKVMTDNFPTCTKCQQCAILRPQLEDMKQQVSQAINTQYSVESNPFIIY